MTFHQDYKRSVYYQLEQQKVLSSAQQPLIKEIIFVLRSQKPIRRTQHNNPKQMKQQNQSIERQNDSQQSFDQQESSSSISSEDQIKQKAVFQIIDQEILIQSKYKEVEPTQRQQTQNQQCFSDKELEQDEREAFLYLLSVRKEKKTLLQKKKKRKSQFKKKVSQIDVKFTQKKLTNITNNNLVQIHENQTQQNTSKHKQCQTTKQETQNVVKQESQNTLRQNQHNNLREEPQNSFKEDSLQKEEEWCECIIKNFRIVVENVKYLIKTTPSYSQNNKKLNTKLYESITLDHQPVLFELIKLTTGQIQDAIRKLSLELQLGPKTKFHTQPVPIPSTNSGKSSLIKYSLWIYSLLALHQAWSAYKHFESLAQINFVLTQNIKQPHKLSIQQKKSLLIVLTLITKLFEQRHLEKFFHQIL